MSSITVTLPDGSQRTIPAGTRPIDVAKAIGPRLAQDAIAFAYPIVVGAAMLALWVTARPGVSPETLEASLFEEMNALRDVSADDVARAISLIESHHLVDLQKMDNRADLLSQFTTLFDDPGRLNSELERVRAVTPERVRELAAKYLGADNRVVLWYLPGGAPLAREGAAA